jgi:N-acetylneuraminic acid mutarotase
MHRSRLSRRNFALGSAVLAASVAGRPFVPRTARAAAPAWQQLAADAPGPFARWDHTIAADDEAKQLIVFGGRDANYAALNDTWIFDLDARTWTQIDSDAPAPRFGHAVAVDQATRRLYLFGGQNQDAFFNDTWQFDLESREWRQLDTGEQTAPSPRYGLAGILDGTGGFIVSHGFTFEGRFDDTWSFDLEERSWADVSPAAEDLRPLKRCLHEQVWHATAKRMLLYGGCSSGFGPCPQGDLWSYDPADQSWTELTPAAGPAARSNPALVWDARSERAFLVGGLTDSGYAADLWSGELSGDGFTWTTVETADVPPARASHDAVISAGHLYLFGGTGDAGVFNDLWRLKLPK